MTVSAFRGFQGERTIIGLYVARLTQGAPSSGQGYMVTMQTSLDSSSEALGGIGYDPVFIMGAHRSGTTLLYKLLAETGLFNVVTAYHLICERTLYNSHLDDGGAAERRRLSERFSALELDTRIIDQVRVSPDLPEEYGFLFKSYGFKPRLTPQTFVMFDDFCRKVQSVSHRERPLLLKNPGDFPNFMYIKEVLPTARFIFIHRHPFKVINSQLRSMRALFAVKSEYHALIDRPYDRLFDRPIRLFITRRFLSSVLAFRIVYRNAKLAFHYFLDNCPRLPAHDYLSLRYEDLCSDPESTIESIMSFLALSPPVRSTSRNDAIRTRDVVLLPEVEKRRTEIFEGLQPYFKQFGYSPDPEGVLP